MALRKVWNAALIAAEQVTHLVDGPASRRSGFSMKRSTAIGITSERFRRRSAASRSSVSISDHRHADSDF